MKDIAKAGGLDPRKSIIPMFDYMGGYKLSSYELFCDHQACDPAKIHPNDAGNAHMASKVYKHLFNPEPSPFSEKFM